MRPAGWICTSTFDGEILIMFVWPYLQPYSMAAGEFTWVWDLQQHLFMAAADFTLGRRPPFRGSAETLVAVLIIWNYPIVQSITGIPCPIPLVLFPREVLSIRPISLRNVETFEIFLPCYKIGPPPPPPPPGGWGGVSGEKLGYKQKLVILTRI